MDLLMRLEIPSCKVVIAGDAEQRSPMHQEKGEAQGVMVIPRVVR